MFKYTNELELHNYIIDNFDNYFDFSLKSSEHELSKGRIDFLGEDKDFLYVIELKKETINKHTISQLKNYMKTIRLDFPDKHIKGIALSTRVAKTLDLSKLPSDIDVKILDDVYYNGKVRTLCILEDKEKEKLEQIAKEENRSTNNLIETILKEYLAKK